MEAKKTKKRKLASGRAVGEEDGEEAEADLHALGGKDYAFDELPFEEVPRQENDALKKKPSNPDDLAVVCIRCGTNNICINDVICNSNV